MRTVTNCLLLSAGACLLGSLVSCSRGPATASTAIPDDGQTSHESGRVEVVSPVYKIDRIYKSMTGPWSDREVQLLDSATPVLVWITGAHVEMVGPDGATHMPDQFMCHANLDFDGDWHNDLFRSKKWLDGRLFTLSQGQLHVDFPKGFGLPVMSNEKLDLSTQVLNLNVKDRSFQVRHKVHINFVRDRDLTEPMKPLYEAGVSGMVSLEGRELVFDQKEDGSHGPCKSCCVPGAKAVDGMDMADSLGRQFSSHWVVKPGREVNRTRVTTMMGLPFDTSIHYIAVHMHPFAESLELRDLTTDQTLFKSRARNLENEIGLSHMDALSSVEGVPVFKDHEYELVSVYNNTTSVNQDSMAVMYLYLLDQEYRGPDPLLTDFAQADAAESAADTADANVEQAAGDAESAAAAAQPE